MNKYKRIPIILTVFLLIMSLLMFTACDANTQTKLTAEDFEQVLKESGFNGSLKEFVEKLNAEKSDGLSAYELARQNGFEGSLEDYLESLKGSSEYIFSGGGSSSKELLKKIEELEKTIELLKDSSFEVGYNGNLWYKGRDSGIKLEDALENDETGHKYHINTLAIARYTENATPINVGQTPITISLDESLTESGNLVNTISVIVEEGGTLTVGLGKASVGRSSRDFTTSKTIEAVEGINKIEIGKTLSQNDLLIIGGENDTTTVNVYSNIQTDNIDGNCQVLGREDLTDLKIAVAVTEKIATPIEADWLESGSINNGNNAGNNDRVRLVKYVYLHKGDLVTSKNKFNIMGFNEGHQFGYDGISRGWSNKGGNGYDDYGNFPVPIDGYYRFYIDRNGADAETVSKGVKIFTSSGSLKYGDAETVGLATSWIEVGGIVDGKNFDSLNRGRLEGYIFLQEGDVVENIGTKYKFGMANYGSTTNFTYENVDYDWNITPSGEEGAGAFYKNREKEEAVPNTQNVYIVKDKGYFRIDFAAIDGKAITNQEIIEFAESIKITSSSGFEYSCDTLRDALFDNATAREDNAYLRDLPEGMNIGQDGTIIDGDFWFFAGGSSNWAESPLYVVDMQTNELKEYKHSLGHVNGADYREDEDGEGYLLCANGNAQGTQFVIYKNPKAALEKDGIVSKQNIEMFFDLSKVNISVNGKWIKYGKEDDQIAEMYNKENSNGMSIFNTSEKYEGTDYNKFAIYPDGTACFGETREFVYYIGTTDKTDRGQNAILKIQLGMGSEDLREDDAKNGQGHISGGSYQPLTLDGEYNGTFKVVNAYYTDELIGQAQGATYYDGDIFVGANYSSMNTKQLKLIDGADPLKGTIKVKHEYLYHGILQEAEFTAIKDGKLYVACMGYSKIGVFDVSKYE